MPRHIRFRNPTASLADPLEPVYGGPSTRNGVIVLAKQIIKKLEKEYALYRKHHSYSDNMVDDLNESIDKLEQARSEDHLKNLELVRRMVKLRSQNVRLEARYQKFRERHRRVRRIKQRRQRWK